MTSKRTAVLKFIVAYHHIHKFSPSHREICDHIDTLRLTTDPNRTSTSSTRYQIHELIKNGYLTGEPYIARGYAPTEAGLQYIKSLHAKKT